MKFEEIVTSILTTEGIKVYGWEYPCWRCNKKTIVHTYFLNKQLKEYMEPTMELGNIGLSTLPFIDNYLLKNYPTININYSKTPGEYVVSNNCAHCNALIGNNFVVDDSHEIFTEWIMGDLEKYLVEVIPVSKSPINQEELKKIKHDFVQIG